MASTRINPADAAPTAIPTEPKGQAGLRGAMIWAVAACVLLAGSGAVRAIQDRQFEQEKGYLEDCPFPLVSLPKKIGNWRMSESGEQPLDPNTVRITGSTEHTQRFYVDDLTGVTLGVLVLFGPAEPVLPHTPQVCYPATGHAQLAEPTDRQVKADDGKSYPFRTAVYGKSGGRAILRSEVYHSYRLYGTWSPDAGSGRKLPRKNPGIFKVQVHRIVAANERRDRDNPIEQFLAILVPEIERRIAEAPANHADGGAAAPTKSASSAPGA